MPSEPDDSGMDQFVAEARAFLDEHATPHAHTSDEVVWGEGEDRITYFSTDPPEVEAAKVAGAKAWQKVRYDNGFGWITGPSEFGGRGLSSLHDLVYDGLEAEYDVPDTGVLSLIGPRDDRADDPGARVTLDALAAAWSRARAEGRVS